MGDRMGDLGLGGPTEVTVHVADDDAAKPEKKGGKKKKGKKGAKAAAAAADAGPEDVELGESKDEGRVVVGDEAKIFEAVNNSIATIKKQTTVLNRLNRNPVDQKEMDALSDALQACMKKATTAGAQGKNQLDQIKAEITKSGSSGSQARANLYNQACREFQDAMTAYNTLFQQIKDQSTESKKGQLRMLPGVQLEEEQIDSIIAAGKEGEVMQKAMMMEDLSELQDIVADVEERHAEILKLERSVLELLELFKDLAMLVDVQGEQLNRIEGNIAKAKDNTAKAEVKLKSAEKSQIAARKKQCFLCCCLLIIVLVALIIGGFFGGVFKSS